MVRKKLLIIVFILSVIRINSHPLDSNEVSINADDFWLPNIRYLKLHRRYNNVQQQQSVTPPLQTEEPQTTAAIDDDSISFEDVEKVEEFLNEINDNRNPSVQGIQTTTDVTPSKEAEKNQSDPIIMHKNVEPEGKIKTEEEIVKESNDTIVDGDDDATSSDFENEEMNLTTDEEENSMALEVEEKETATELILIFLNETTTEKTKESTTESAEESITESTKQSTRIPDLVDHFENYEYVYDDDEDIVYRDPGFGVNTLDYEMSDDDEGLFVVIEALDLLRPTLNADLGSTEEEEDHGSEGRFPTRETVTRKNTGFVDLSGLKEGDIIGEISIGENSVSNNEIEENELSPPSTSTTTSTSSPVQITGTSFFTVTSECSGPDSTLDLFAEDDFSSRSPAVRFSGPSSRLGRKGIHFESVIVSGKCCWELYSKPGFSGRKLGLCPGKYSSSFLGSSLRRVKSLKPIPNPLVYG